MPEAEQQGQQAQDADRIKSWTRLQRLFSYTKPYRLRLAVAIVCLVGASGLGLVYPYFFGELANSAFANASLGPDEIEAARVTLTRSTLVLVAVFLGQSVFIFFRHYLMTWLGERVVADLRVELYRHLAGMPQSYFHTTRTGELLSRLGDDVTRLQDTVGQDLSMALRNLLTLTGGIVILLVTNTRLTLTMLAVVPALVIAAGIWSRVIRRLSREAQDALAKANGELQEGISAIETVQAFTREEHEVQRYGGAIERTFGLFIARALARSWFSAVISFLFFSAVAGIFWLGGSMVLDQSISVGEFTSFIFYTMMVAAAVGTFGELFSSLQSTFGATTRIFEILDSEPEIRDPERPVEAPALCGEIVFRDVTFAYADRDVNVVDSINLHIKQGEICALVGPSGSGKTTLGRLLLRFWDPVAGAVELDGHDLRTLALHDLRGAMALVSQDPVLFSGSIRENIRYGRLDASDAEVEAAARAANADGFIRAFPSGYDTIVGERGVKLSGGQRQRVSIARAILRDPKILVLDEATSALDSESEHLVQEALDKLQRGRTTVVIAHRLSTIRDADRIVVLKGGKIVETGRHDQLMAEQGVYARLVARQAALADAELAS